MAETLDTLGEKITALTTSVGEMRKQLNGHDQQFVSIDQRFVSIDQRFVSIDQRFDKVDQRFDRVEQRLDKVDERLDKADQRFGAIDLRFDELGSSLRTHIEAVDAKVDLVLEKMSDLMVRDIHNSAAHARIGTRLDDHEVRLIALESGKRGAPADADDSGRSKR